MKQDYTDGITEAVNKGTATFAFQKPKHTLNVLTF
jgi:hypothetical protein